MNICELARRAGFAVAAAILAATVFVSPCEAAATGGGSPETVLYAFQGAPDGVVPSGVLVDVAGTFYGTTALGGTGDCSSGEIYGSPVSGCGSVFKLAPSGAGWTESVLYSFQGGSDGLFPSGGLTSPIGGKLYGTTELGGNNGSGTVFSITPQGSEAVVHAFSGGDGLFPVGTLVKVGGTFYGTTASSAYSITPQGTETVLHYFNPPFDANGDGSSPDGGLVADAAGNLYGTTFYGGNLNCLSQSVGEPNFGCGTVFELTPPTSPGGSWGEIILFAFPSNTKYGANPDGELAIAGSGTLVGTTATGGSSANCPAVPPNPSGAAPSCGTVFKIVQSQGETVIHNFHGRDGAYPTGKLASVGGKLFGTTEFGGTGACPATSTTPAGCGTVFSITPQGLFTVVYSFQGGSDGAGPVSGLINIGGELYGTTTTGGGTGCGGYGCGTVFEITP